MNNGPMTAEELEEMASLLASMRATERRYGFFVANPAQIVWTSPDGPWPPTPEDLYRYALDAERRQRGTP